MLRITEDDLSSKTHKGIGWSCSHYEAKARYMICCTYDSSFGTN